MRVIATKPGYDNAKVREVDEEFDMPDGSTGSWFVPVEADPPKTERKQAKGKGESDLT